HALVVAFSDGQVGVENPLVKGAILLFKAVFIRFRTPRLLNIAAAGAADAECRIGEHKNSQVRLQIVAQELVELQDGGAAKFAASTLVSNTGVGEAIGNYPLAAMQCGKNQLIDMLCPVRKHQSEFGHGRETLGTRAEQDAAQLLPDGRTSR